MTDDTSGLDLHDLARRTRSVREFEHRPAPGVVLQVRFPSRFEAVALDARHAGDRAALARAMVESSVTGWSGVVVGHAHPESKAPREPLPFAPETLALVLDEQIGWLLALWTEIQQRMHERQARIEAATKNWLTESVTSAGDSASAVH